jgi:hypothetical protein
LTTSETCVNYSDAGWWVKDRQQTARGRGSGTALMVRPLKANQRATDVVVRRDERLHRP